MKVKNTIKETADALWNSHRKLVYIIAIFFATQLAIVATVWNQPPIWDASVYIGMGKRLFSEGMYGIWEALRPIMMPLILGGLWKAGVPMIGFPYLLSLLIATAGLVATYFLTFKILDRKMALYTTGIIASTSLFYSYTHQVLTGIPASFLVFAAAYSAYQRQNILGGGLNSLAFLTRFPAAIVGPALAFYVFVRDVKTDFKKAFMNAFYYTLGFFAVATPFFAFNYHMYGDILRPLTAGASVPLLNPERYFFGLFYMMEAVLANPLLVLTPVGLYAAFKGREWVYGAFASSLVALYGFFTLYPHKEARFLLIFLPLMAIFAARGLVMLEEQVLERFDFGLETFMRVFMAVVIVLMLFNFTSTYTEHQWADEERIQFLQGMSDLDDTRVAGNDPVVNVYGDFQYTPLRPENLNETYPNVRGEVDYYVFNSCAWYCTDAIPACEETVDNMLDEIESDHVKSVEVEGVGCTYTVYEVE